MSAAEHTTITVRRERWRSLCSGILETAASTFLLLIATRHFHSGPWTKALIAAGSSIGLLASPVVMNRVQGLRLTPSSGASRLLLCGAVALALAVVIPASRSLAFAVACVIAIATPAAVVPLMTQIYQENYPADRRGRLFSQSVMIRISAAMAAGAIAGLWLDPVWPNAPAFLQPLLHGVGLVPSRERLLVLAFAITLACTAWSLRGIPSRPMPPAAGSHPLHAWSHVHQDRVFRQALIAWMLMGFANLAMLPLRVEYLGNPRYGMSKSAGEIALFTLVVPNLARLVMSPIWGRLFDRMNFFALRCALNLGFTLGIAAFFASDTTTGLLVGAVIYGISTAGGDVAWSLWVTKFAPPDRVADYMSVHTFLTGVRGIIAPVVAFQVVRHWSPAAMGWIAAGLILVATAILLPEIRRHRTAEPGSPPIRP